VTYNFVQLASFSLPDSCVRCCVSKTFSFFAAAAASFWPLFIFQLKGGAANQT